MINQRELEVSWRALAGVNNYVITVTNYSGDVAATRTVQQSRDPGYVVRIDSGIGKCVNVSSDSDRGSLSPPPNLPVVPRVC